MEHYHHLGATPIADGLKATNEAMNKPDMVNHPPHYVNGNIDCIDAIEAALGHEQFIGYLRGQIIKYTWRLGLKDAAEQEAGKLAWYAARLRGVLK